MKKSSWLLIAGMLLTAMVAITIYWWLTDSSAQLSFESSKQHWLARFPVFMRNARLITGMNLLLLAVAIVFFVKARRDTAYSVLALCLIILDSLLLLWQLFSLL